MERVACRPPGRLRDWKRRYACSTVRCKLGRVCPHPELIKEIQICARLLRKSTTEAWALANFHMKEWLGSEAWGVDGELEQVVPLKPVIKKHVGYFVRKLYEIMVFVEQKQIEQRRQRAQSGDTATAQKKRFRKWKRKERTKKDKGAKKPKQKRSKTIKMFSLLPLSQSFALYNIKIDPSTLAHLCSRIYGREYPWRAFNITQFKTRRTKIGKARFNGLSVDERSEENVDDEELEDTDEFDDDPDSE
ncbi:hypothetical protein PHYSODRAFT_331799 [Phytophthora sojae]|uniref:Uncharacterized protein n=1 Tax=Phytophthora sojae (strain P6497) TaxID=1094619 RepID=G4ZEA5_PHYSP|nr:hypothetical protein PHYSODRAFT_331799 [Phytophthora sojae]EGZ17868.1 hypothetical protein PHYSODRAFT_331799 [Phytophthora sojae]|eukprot:XP_009526926.1 hypothetical protein PHYSODRAFT_331799 [Phytophthora sojae]